MLPVVGAVMPAHVFRLGVRAYGWCMMVLFVCFDASDAPLSGSDASDVPPSGSVVYSCAGSTYVLRWIYPLTTTHAPPPAAASEQ